MDDDYSTPKRLGAPLIQAGLALLVASTLVTFSVLAFRTGFAEQRGRDVTATDITNNSGGAVVLPALGGAVATTDDQATRAERTAETVAAVDSSADEATVLGTRVRKASSSGDSHRGRGLGHERARGDGHHKDDGKGNHDGDGSDDEKAREEDERDDHGDESDDRDDDRDASHGSGSNSGGSGGSGSGGGSRGDSEGSN